VALVSPRLLRYVNVRYPARSSHPSGYHRVLSERLQSSDDEAPGNDHHGHRAGTGNDGDDRGRLMPADQHSVVAAWQIEEGRRVDLKPIVRHAKVEMGAEGQTAMANNAQELSSSDRCLGSKHSG
jgi:hypothetical protein